MANGSRVERWPQRTQRAQRFEPRNTLNTRNAKRVEMIKPVRPILSFSNDVRVSGHSVEDLLYMIGE